MLASSRPYNIFCSFVMPCRNSRPIGKILTRAFLPGAVSRRKRLRQKFLLPQDDPSNRYREFILHSHPVLAPQLLLLVGARELALVSISFYIPHQCDASLVRSCTTLTSKSTLMISLNPSSSFGARYLEAKLVNASFGNIVLFSGLV